MQLNESLSAWVREQRPLPKFQTCFLSDSQTQEMSHADGSPMPSDDNNALSYIHL